MKKVLAFLGLAAVITFSAIGVYAQSSELPSEQELLQKIKAMTPQKRAEVAKQFKQVFAQQYQNFCDRNSSNIIPTVMFMSRAGADQAAIKSNLDASGKATPSMAAFLSDYLDFLFRVKAEDQDELLHKSRDWCVNRINAKGGLQYIATMMPESESSTDLAKLITIQKALNQ
ncbi:hypothetical protein [Paraburkholderia caribensis]|uniref:hypothetical protein n=1 Tax=Paraburkholderia caribensis TaxID=75105 RepID=UPI00209066B5|nr:hypothetical protein [Paraburkholderia caribensis]MCO4880259.1 hypothetical protein [Paraburkholderia caribensis]